MRLTMCSELREKANLTKPRERVLSLTVHRKLSASPISHQDKNWYENHKLLSFNWLQFISTIITVIYSSFELNFQLSIKIALCSIIHHHSLNHLPIWIYLSSISTFQQDVFCSVSQLPHVWWSMQGSARVLCKGVRGQARDQLLCWRANGWNARYRQESCDAWWYRDWWYSTLDGFWYIPRLTWEAQSRQQLCCISERSRRFRTGEAIQCIIWGC